MSVVDDIRSISIVVPVFNEAESLPILFQELMAVMAKITPIATELIFVDDGSIDGSRDILRRLAAEHACVKALVFSRNFGQTAAMSCGIKAATGDIIIPMDADLQNDPEDIPLFLDQVRAGYSCVSGWRKRRQDALFHRRLPSWLANALISWLTGVNIHDYGCSMKAYRSDIIKDVELYGEMHRFIPAYAAWSGARVTEIVVHHRARRFGRSNYGLMRVFKVLLDLIVVKFLVQYFNRPMHFFGGVGISSLLLGFAALLLSVVLKLAGLRSFVSTPLPVIGMMFIILAVQFILTGLVAEVLMRTYYSAQRRDPFTVKEKINF